MTSAEAISPPRWTSTFPFPVSYSGFSNFQVGWLRPGGDGECSEAPRFSSAIAPTRSALVR
jgi:hypothetical protein